MLDGGPYVLQGRAHLKLEAEFIEFRHIGVVNDRLWQTADVVQRVIAEAVELVELAFVNGLLPVDVEGSFDNGCHLVNIVCIEGDDSQAEDVGDVVK